MNVSTDSENIKSIKTLVRILRFFGWLLIVIGGLFLISSLSQSDSVRSVSFPLWIMLIIQSPSLIVKGLVFLGLSYGLSKKEKWAWYATFTFFVLNFFFFFISAIIFYSKFSIGIFPYIIIDIILFVLLIEAKKLFIGQPKEKISQWFHKPYFIVVIAGILISCFLSMGSLFAHYHYAQEEIETPQEKTTELEKSENQISEQGKRIEDIINEKQKLTEIKKPDQVVLEFYQCYMAEIEKRGSDMMSHIKVCGHIEEKFERSLFEIKEKCRLYLECPLVDHIFWASDVPNKENVQVADVKIENETAEVIVTFLPIWPEHKIKAFLLLENNEWKINNIQDISHGEF